jgi:hypothetical protein
MPTMLYKFIDGIHVAVHLPSNPTDAEWDAYIKDIGESLPGMTGLLSYSEGGGPTPPQRKAINRFWAAQTKKVPLAIVTTSKVVKILVTALSWVMGERIRGFTTVDEGLEYLDISPDRREGLKIAVEELMRSLHEAQGQ